MQGTIFFLIAIGLPIICGTLIVLSIIVLSAFKKTKTESITEDESRILQEMHQSLLRMEKRIDALETIYFDMDRESKGDHS